MLDDRGLCLAVLTLFMLCQNCCGGVGFKNYRNCQDVKNDLGSAAANGEYTIYLKMRKNVGVNVHCVCKLNNFVSTFVFYC